MKKLKKDEIDKYIIRMFGRKVVQRKINSGKNFRWVIRFKDGVGVGIEYQSYKGISIVDVFDKNTLEYIRFRQRLNSQKITNMERMLKLKSVLL